MKVKFWKEFWSGDNSKVNSATVLAVLLGAPIVGLGWVAAAYHIFWLKKGLDGPSVQLLLGLLTAATTGVIGAGVSFFSRSTMTSIQGPVARAKPAPPEGDKV